ncbi:MAG: apolipoprotein N-acyltransferase [Pirellulaceae bacterium]
MPMPRDSQSPRSATSRPPLAAPHWAIRWLDSPLWLSLAGNLCLWAALPPLRWSLLAWVGLLFWLILIKLPHLRGRRPYVVIWLSSALFWMAVLQGVRLAHAAMYLGWVALALYLGIYLALFIGIARQAVHRWRVPLLVAAPVAWTGIEMLRGYGPLGFSVATLAQTQIEHLGMIQVADLCGAYTLSFIMMFVGAGVVTMVPMFQPRRRLSLAIPVLSVVILAAAYGRFRLGQEVALQETAPTIRVALIQGSLDTLFEDNPGRASETLEQYNELTCEASARFQPLDLVVWPESMFPPPDILVDEGAELELEPAIDRALLDHNTAIFDRLVRNGIRRINEPTDVRTTNHATNWLLGTTTWQFGAYPSRRYNTALLVDSQGEITGRYFKMHPVIFGEYVPFGEMIPALYGLFPLPNGLTAGTRPTAMHVKGLTLSPSICFESTIPHLLRRHVVELARGGQSPDVLVNLTNDGWFWGSSVLDLQLDCAVLRAVELRRPVLVAANTGFSAWINGNGRILAQGPRRATGIVMADVSPDGRWSGYVLWGDLPVSICALCCLLVAASGLVQWGRRNPPPGAPGTG